VIYRVDERLGVVVMKVRHRRKIYPDR